MGINKLLILACSKRKRSDIELLPAIERYDGPIFRLLRRFLRQPTSASLDIYILSAEFGLISQDRLIPDYDRKMTKQRSQQLQPEVVNKLRSVLASKHYSEICICLSRDYFTAIEKYDTLIHDDSVVVIATGAIGKKLVTLHHWLYGDWPQLHQSKTALTSAGKAYLKGVEVTKTPEQIIDLARQRLADGTGKPRSYQSWYVLIDGQKISPKWLVSELTGLPVSSFHSSAARKLLIKLGIEVKCE